MTKRKILQCIDISDINNRIAKRALVDLDTLRKTQAMLEDIRRDGDVAIKSLATKFDESGKIHTRDDLDQAANDLDPQLKKLLQRTAGRITLFANAQRSAFGDVMLESEGAKISHRLTPVERVGCYVPGGRYPLPSSLLMTALTAKAAGVKDIVICCPKPSPIILAAAALCEATCLIGLGGVQAIAAMSYGYQNIFGCDVITGPGNRWVSAAKELLNGKVRMDLPAGPTELVVIADASADVEFVAADLIAQAEHDSDAWPILIAIAGFEVEKLELALNSQLQKLTTKQTALEALNNGFCVKVDDVKQAARITNEIAPEHLSLQVDSAAIQAEMFDHYGSIFIGSMAAEALGDYGIGPNHVLPTAGSARKYGALSVLNFLRVQTRIEASSIADQMLSDARDLANIEGLVGHAAAISVRR